MPVTISKVYKFLASLLDVAITSPSNGQALIYNGSTSKWNNQTTSLTPTGILYGSSYGVVSDGQLITDLRVISGSPIATSATANFTSAVNGKTIKYFQGDTGARGGLATVTYVNATTITLSVNSPVTISSGETYAVLGTDNATALNAMFTAAGNLVNGGNTGGDIQVPPLKGATVICALPAFSAQSICLFAAQLNIPAGVILDAGVMLFSAITNSVNDRNYCMNVAPGASIKRLRLNASLNMGIQFGSSDVQSQAFIEDLEVWAYGTDYNGGLSVPNPIGVAILGYGWKIGKIFSKSGSLGGTSIFFAGCSDIQCDQLFAIGGSLGVQVAGGEQVSLGDVSIDTCGTYGLVIDNSHNITGKIRAFNNYQTQPTVALTDVLLVGAFGTYAGGNTPNSAIRLEVNASVTGGTIASLANMQGESFLKLSGSNAPQFTNPNPYTVAPITVGVTYGAGLAGELSIKQSLDAGITPYTGTQYGSLETIQSGSSNYNALTIPTRTPGDNTLNAASTAFVHAAIAGIAAGGLTLIQTVTLGSAAASVDITGLHASGFKNFFLLFRNFVSVTGSGDTLQFTYYANGTWVTSNISGCFSVLDGTQYGGNMKIFQSNSYGALPLTPPNMDNVNGVNGEGFIEGFDLTDVVSFDIASKYYHAAACRGQSTAYFNNTTSPVVMDGIRLFFAGGNTAAGASLSLWGYNV